MTLAPLVVVQYSAYWIKLTESWLYRQVASLPERIETHVVCERLVDGGAYPVAHLHYLGQVPGPARYLDRAARRLRLRRHLAFPVRVAKSCRARVLHSHFGQVGWGNIGLAREAGVKHVVSFYGTDATRLPEIDGRWIVRYAELFAAADSVLCEGPAFRESLRVLGCSPAKLRIQPLGVAVRDIPFVPRSREPREQVRILIAGTFQEKKGIPDAIAALGEAQRRGIDLTLTIAGEATREKRSIAEKGRIIAALHTEGLMARTRLLGYIPARVLREESYRHHLFLSPSKKAADGDAEGGAPVTILEMAATGLPVVSTRHCDIPSIVKDGVTGLLADEGDVSALSDHVVTLARDPELADRMGRAGRLLVESKHDSSVLAESLAAIYLGVAG